MEFFFSHFDGGLDEIPLENVVGTKLSFHSASFYPLKAFSPFVSNTTPVIMSNTENFMRNIDHCVIYSHTKAFLNERFETNPLRPQHSNCINECIKMWHNLEVTHFQIYAKKPTSFRTPGFAENHPPSKIGRPWFCRKCCHILNTSRNLPNSIRVNCLS